MDKIQGKYFYGEEFGYHITERKNIDSIREKGLIPQCGERSKSVDDNAAVYFTKCITLIDDWFDLLYPNRDINELLLLRFNLMRRKWYINSYFQSDCYLERKVRPECLQYGEILNPEEGRLLNWKEPIYEKKLIWKPISEYPKLM